MPRGYGYGGFTPWTGDAPDALSQMGENLAKDITEAHKANEEDRNTRALADAALQSGVISHDVYASFINGGQGQRRKLTGQFVHSLIGASQEQQRLDLAKQAQQLNQAKYQRDAFQAAYEQGWKPPASVPPVTDPQGNTIAYPLPTGPGGNVTYKTPDTPDVSEPLPKSEPFIDPSTGKAVPGMAIQRGPGKDFKVITIPSQGYTGAEMSKTFQDFGVTPAQMLDSTHHHGYANGKKVPWEQATDVQIGEGTNAPTLPKDVFNQLKQLAFQRTGTPLRGAKGAGVIQGPPPPSQGGSASIPQPAVDYLKANPETAAQFDAKFGAGAAAIILGQ